MSKKIISLERLAQNNEKMEIVIDKKDASVLASAQSYVDEKIEEVAGIDVSNIYNKDEVDSALENKVEKVDGMGLSTNDYSDADKEKVDSIPSDAKFTDTVYDDTELSDRVDDLETDTHNHSNKSVLDATTASFTTDDKTKLDAVGSITTTQIDALFA